MTHVQVVYLNKVIVDIEVIVIIIHNNIVREA